MKIPVCIFLLVSVFFTGTFAQERKYSVSNAHAHNDYEHPQPFYSAYNAGFGSMEADIFLRDGGLYVAHNAADIRSERTLSTLYLDPLQTAIQKNRGHVYADSLKQLLLLIDLKTAAEPTLDALLKLLTQYDKLTACGSLKIVITGNQPAVSKFLSYPDWLFFDGKFQLTYDEKSLQKIALFSDNLRNYTSWKGEDVPAEEDRKKILDAITKAHQASKPIRFWNAPDNPNAWRQLMLLNVDYINTDKIEEIAAFLRN